jgi:hypothetical protein
MPASSSAMVPPNILLADGYHKPCHKKVYAAEKGTAARAFYGYLVRENMRLCLTRKKRAM